MSTFSKFMKLFALAGGVRSQVNPLTGGIELSAGGVKTYLGLVATRCSTPTAFTPANKQAMSRTKHVATENIDSLKVVFANFYTQASGTGDTNPGSAATFKASIEYPAGTIAGVLKFSGNASGQCLGGETITTDLLELPDTIPVGAAFYLRAWRDMPAGILYNASSGLNNAAGVVPNSGEWCTFGVTTPDLTDVITNSNNQQTGVVFRPAAIIGQASRPSLFIIGDSRCGNGAAYDNNTLFNYAGGLGEVERATLKSFASFNASVSGERMHYVANTNNASKRILMSSYCSHIIVQLGINDFSTYSAATHIANLFTFLAKCGNKPTFVCTVAPYSTSSDSWATTVNQVAHAGSNTNRVTYNDAVRAGLASPVVGVIEIADQVESARNSGIWKVTGSANGYTSDGLHENNAMCNLIENSNAFAALGVLAR